MTPVFAATCPSCGAGLRVRQRRRDGHQFVACSGYPDCRFTSDLIPPSDPFRDEVSDALRRLIGRWHPDRVQTVSAHEVTCELNALRDWLTAHGELERRTA